MLVFGFHRRTDFVNAGMALRRSGAPNGTPPAMAKAGALFHGSNPPGSEAINAVFTRIVNDYSIVHGTTAIGPVGANCAIFLTLVLKVRLELYDAARIIEFQYFGQI
jgi:hypothetical protein